MSLDIDYLPLNWLLDHQTPGNPKDHDIPGIQQSMEEHGFVDPPIIDGRTDRVLGGHGRLEALDEWKTRGHARPSGIDQDDHQDWAVPVLIGYRSEDDEDARRMVIRLNRLTERGGWLPDKLAAFDVSDLLEELWDPGELDDLMAQLDGEVELGPMGADNTHADLPPARKGEPPPPRQAQGMKEILMILQADYHREAMEHLTKLKRVWREDVTGMVMLRALRECAEGAEAMQVRKFVIDLPAGQHEITHNLGSKEVVLTPVLPDMILDANRVRVTLAEPTTVVVKA